MGNISRNYESALSFWKVGLQYFMLVENVTQEVEAAGNKLAVVSDQNLSPQEYVEKTRWSDFRIVIPTLFCFYHGLELLLKGFLMLEPSCNLKAEHRTQRLCSHFIKYYPESKKLGDFFRRYSEVNSLPGFLKDFVQKNSLSINELYEALRYPTDRTFSQLREYISLQYKGMNGIAFFTELRDDIETARKEIVQLGRSLEDKRCGVCP
jgi:hypothetical protein